MRERIKLMLVALLLLVAAGVNAQVTTSALAGVVCDEENHEALIGATVTALHELAIQMGFTEEEETPKDQGQSFEDWLAKQNEQSRL